MKSIIAAIAVAASFSAQALTFESGQVFSNGEVVHVSETAIGQRQLEEDGYIVVGNNVVIDLDEYGTATVSVQDAVAGGDRLKAAIGRDLTKELAEAVKTGEISEIAGNKLAELNEDKLADIVEQIESGEISLEEVEHVTSVLDDLDINLDEAFNFESPEEALEAGFIDQEQYDAIVEAGI